MINRNRGPDFTILLVLGVALGVFTVIVNIWFFVGSRKRTLEDVEPYLKELPDKFPLKAISDVTRKEKYLKISVDDFEAWTKGMLKEEKQATPDTTEREKSNMVEGEESTTNNEAKSDANNGEKPDKNR